MGLSNRIYQIWDLLRHPRTLYEFFVYQFKRLFLWNACYRTVREPKVLGAIQATDEVHCEIEKALRAQGLRVEVLPVDIDDYRRYMDRARYGRFRGYYRGGERKEFVEKSLEHYVAARLLRLSKGDVYIDVANCASPAPQIYRELYGCETFKQDLVFPEGIHGDVIGGDAGAMPVEDGFATKMALHCSFEHFEGDADSRFIQEAGRVLRRGGRLCILPLYLWKEHAVQTDPAALPRGGVDFDEGALMYCARGWKRRHARHYDAVAFRERVVRHLGPLRLTLYSVSNARQIDRECYLRFAALFEKP